MICNNCDGSGEVLMTNPYYGVIDCPNDPPDVIEICIYCAGVGEIENLGRD